MSSYKGRFGRLTWLGLGICCWLLPSVAAGTTLPQVKVSFVENATEFLFPLADVEATATDGVVDRLARAFGFLHWAVDSDSQDLAAEWVVFLRQEPAGPGFRIWLEHHVRVKDAQFELPQIRENKLLYDVGSVIPFQSPSRLRDRVADRLQQQLSDDFLQLVEEQFLRRVPLGGNVLAEADVDPPRLVVPLRLSEMKATSDSMLGVRLLINNQQFGMFVLKAASQVVDGELIGCVHGRIHEFEVPPIDAVPPFWWHPELPAAIARAESTEVYMHEYFADPAAGSSTLGGISLEPDD